MVEKFKGIREEDFKGKPRDIYANKYKEGPIDGWLNHKWNELFPDEGTKRQEKAIDITNKAPSYEGEVTRGVESLSSKEPSIFDGTFEDYEKSNIVEPGDSFSLMSDEPTEDSTEKSWWGSKTDDERKDLTDIGVKLFQDMYAGPSMDKALATDTMIARMMGSPSKSKFRKGFDPYTEFREREELRKKDKQSGLFSKILARGLADKYKVNLSDSEKESLGIADIGGEGDDEGDKNAIMSDEEVLNHAEAIRTDDPNHSFASEEERDEFLKRFAEPKFNSKELADDPNRTFRQFKIPYELGINEVDYKPAPEQKLLSKDVNLLKHLESKLGEVYARGDLYEGGKEPASKEPIVNVRSSDLKNLVSSFEDVADQLALSKIHDRLKGKDESAKPDEAELAFREREVEAREEETEAIQAQNYRNMLKDRMETLFPDKYRR